MLYAWSMRITKLIHSCLLLEEKGKVALVDPGNYSYEDGFIDIDELPQLDYLVITHEHQDHMYIPFVKEIMERNPGTVIIGTESIQEILEKEGLSVRTQSDSEVHLVSAAHEPLLNIPIPQNNCVTFFNSLTHPGDSLEFESTARILALPIQAPWGSMVAACEKAVDLQPEFIIPIHDWHWNDRARSGLYGMAKSYFAPMGIQFIEIENGHPVEL